MNWCINTLAAQVKPRERIDYLLSSFVNTTKCYFFQGLSDRSRFVYVNGIYQLIIELFMLNRRSEETFGVWLRKWPRPMLKYLFNNVTVPQMIRQDPSVMSWSLWIGTLTTTSAALVAAALAALLAVLNTATSPRSKILSIPSVYFINILTRKSLFFSIETRRRFGHTWWVLSYNLFSVLMCLASTCTWLAQYYTRLYVNVLPKEDIDNMWTSEGSAELGYSFW